MEKQKLLRITVPCAECGEPIEYSGKPGVAHCPSCGAEMGVFPMEATPLFEGKLMYEKLTLITKYLEFTLAPRRFRSFRLHLGEEGIMDESGASHYFDLTWFKDTEELIAAEVEESLGTILPLNFKLKKSMDRYLFLGTFTEKGIDDLLLHQGRIIEHLWELHTEHKETQADVTD